MSRKRRADPKYRERGARSPQADQLRLNRIMGEREYERICSLFGQAGFKVWRFSQPRATMQTRGPCDLLCTDPAARLAFWWESKYGGSRLTRDQRLFREHMLAAGWTHRHGDYDAALVWLVELGRARRYPSGLIALTPRR